MENLRQKYKKSVDITMELCSNDGLFKYFTRRFTHDLFADKFDPATKMRYFEYAQSCCKNFDEAVLTLARVNKNVQTYINNLFVDEIEYNIKEIMGTLITKITGEEYTMTAVALHESDYKVRQTFCDGVKNCRFHNDYTDLAFASDFDKTNLLLNQNEAILRGDLMYFDELDSVMCNTFYLTEDLDITLETLHDQIDNPDSKIFWNPILDEHKDEIEKELNRIFWEENAESKKPVLDIYYDAVMTYAHKHNLNKGREYCFYELTKPFFSKEEEAE